VFIAAGVGAFLPRPLKVAGIEPFEGTQVLHGAPAPGALAGQEVLIFGDDDAALDAAVALATATDEAQRPARLTLIHRREVFSATPDTVARMRAACAAGHMDFLAAQPTGLEHSDGRLTSMLLIDAEGKAQRLAADTVLALLGLSPKLGPIADWGLALAKRQLQVCTEQFQTSVPGIHAVGDINTYPGKRKLITCGFHEATLAAYGAAQRLRPDQPLLLQYTTTSPRLHQLLGV
jgi:thioredoxin reductase (NADPH)